MRATRLTIMATIAVALLGLGAMHVAPSSATSTGAPMHATSSDSDAMGSHSALLGMCLALAAAGLLVRFTLVQGSLHMSPVARISRVVGSPGSQSRGSPPIFLTLAVFRI